MLTRKLGPIHRRESPLTRKPGATDHTTGGIVSPTGPPERRRIDPLMEGFRGKTHNLRPGENCHEEASLKGTHSPVAAAFRELSGDENQLLESGLIDAAQRAGLSGREIESIERTPRESTWYRTEVVTAELDSGEQLRCFLKDFGSYTREKGQMAARRERERFFYTDVFRNGELGLPTFVTDIWSERTMWLFLEFVDGVPLGWVEVETWYEAAEWLGRFQTAVADRLPMVQESGHFLERDTAYFQRIARNAKAGATQFGKQVALQVESALPAYLHGAEQLIRHPQTLVHGAFRPQQIRVAPEQTPVRICTTDWEIAAIGSSLYDLAALTDGFEGRSLQTFFDRFLTGATWLRDDPPGLTDLQLAIETCRTHRMLKWIAQGQKRGFSPEEIREMAASLSQPAEELKK